MHDDAGRRTVDRFEFGGEDHFPTLGKLHGVADEIRDDLTQTHGVADDDGRHPGSDAQRQLDSLLCRAGAERIYGAAQTIGEGEWLRPQLQSSRLDLREVENVVDDVEQGLG